MTSRACIACVLLAVSGIAFGQAETSSSMSVANGTPLVQLIETVSKKTGKNFILDPRVGGNVVLVGMDPSKITYADLLTVLQVHGFAAFESGGLVRIIPDALARANPSPLITGNDKHPDSEMVTRIIRVKSVPAAQLVPILRALLPQNAHLAAIICTNELIMVDSFANVRRIESVVAAMDKGDPLPLEKCDARVRAPPPAPPRAPPPPREP
jgi:general secretion pathway protein D